MGMSKNQTQYIYLQKFFQNFFFSLGGTPVLVLCSLPIQEYQALPVDVHRQNFYRFFLRNICKNWLA